MIPIDIVPNLLKEYDAKDHQRLEFVRQKLALKDGWDKSINGVDLSLLLAYEYGIAAERITHGRVRFEAIIDRLFKELGKFRLGELKDGDEDIIYGKSFDDPTAFAAKSEKFDREVRKNTGAAHFMYFNEDGRLCTAVAIFGKKRFLPDEHGKVYETSGTDFSDLSDLRQTVFHEWTHQMEKQATRGALKGLPDEYVSVDRRHFINVNKVTAYRFATSNGVSDLVKLQEDRAFKISTGLVTYEDVSGEIKIRNQITEGMVELTAREMVRSLNIPETEIDSGKYYEAVEASKRIIKARDKSKGRGKTFADFLTNSTVIKGELERMEMDGKDALHHMGDYIDTARDGRTKKRKFMRDMPSVEKDLAFTSEQSNAIKQHGMWYSSEITDEMKDEIVAIIIEGHETEDERREKASEIVDRFEELVREEQSFFDEISEKLEKSYECEKNKKIRSRD